VQARTSLPPVFSLKQHSARAFLRSTSLVYQLTIAVPLVQGWIKQALQTDPSIPNKNLGVQFTILIYHPILAIKHLIFPLIVIIDPLDKCKDRDGIVKLIKIITGVFQQECTFLLFFFFTSLAEDYITASFVEPTTKVKTSHLALED
jgi:hypothetical protein